MSSSVPEYESYDLIDRYHLHRYPAPEPPTSKNCGVPTIGGITTTYHTRVSYGGHPQPPPYHYALPSEGAPNYQIYATDYCAEGPPQQIRTAVPNPDYYRMFNSWFAYSGEGVGPPPFIKPAYGSPMRPNPDMVGRAPSNVNAAARNAHYAKQSRHVSAEPSQLYAHRYQY
ncbi:unnamed protein product [Strongylus vulgaris]|uniref:Uncharacterized protein n=1 Tax=Strongylus vulgaris TaxID=40348 RepID=A0A3P7KUR8_STRVU|nr:unnamed protein product [Strongylus vulgaris]